MQKSYINYKDNISSINTNFKYVGILQEGRYRGFDALTKTGGFGISIAHTSTGHPLLNLDLTTSDPIGIWVSRQGVVIQEDAAMAFTMASNAGSSAQRNDLIIGRHHHDTINPGGIPATYEIVQGPSNSSALPTPSGNDFVIIGTLTLPAGASDLTNLAYTPATVPGLGNTKPAQLDKPNVFTDQQSFAQAADIGLPLQNFEITNRGTISSLLGGNLFKVASGQSFLDLMPDRPNGTEIKIYFNFAITIRSFLNQLVGGTGGAGVRAGYAAGYRPIVIEYAANDNLVVNAFQIATFIKVSTTVAFSSGTPVYGDFWKLISVSDASYQIAATNVSLAATNTSLASLSAQVAALTALLNNVNPVRNLRYIDYLGLISADFDSSGLAKSGSIYLNHAICNGNNGTPNLGGKVLVGLNPSNFLFDTIGNTGGEESHVLVMTELPNSGINFDTLTGNHYNGTSSNGALQAVGYPLTASGDQTKGSGTTAPLGLGLGHNNLQPYYTILPIIRIV